MNQPDAICLLGVPVHPVTMAETIQRVARYMAGNRAHQIATVNPEFIMKAQEDGHFRQVLQETDLCIPDGIGLLYAARRYRQQLPERVPGSELVYHLAEAAALHGWRLFLLGAQSGIAEEAAGKLCALYPGLQIAGTFAGSPDPVEDAGIVARINASGAGLLYVAYGAPWQDKWIARNAKALQTVRVAIGVGGALDFIAGRAIRAPLWLRRLNLEWLYRLLREPWRWRRMLALPRFAWRVIRTPYKPCVEGDLA